MYGNIAHMKAKGHLANIVLEMISQMSKQVEAEKSKDGLLGNESSGTTDVAEIDTLVLIDRTSDWVSPLVTPLTYEALIDELLTIATGVVYVTKFALVCTARST